MPDEEFGSSTSGEFGSDEFIPATLIERLMNVHRELDTATAKIVPGVTVGHTLKHLVLAQIELTRAIADELECQKEVSAE